MLSFTLALMSVVSFDASASTSTNVRRLLAEDGSAPVEALDQQALDQQAWDRQAEDAIKLCNQQFGGTLLLSHVRTLHSGIPNFHLDYIPSFPGHFWRRLAPLLDCLHRDQQRDLRAFLGAIYDRMSPLKPEEIKPLFDFAQTRSIPDFIKILASLFGMETPSFVHLLDNLVDFKKYSDQPELVPVHMAHGHQTIRFAEGADRKHQVDVRRTHDEDETIWNLQVLKPSECQQDLKKGQFCCRFQSEKYKPDPVGEPPFIRNWLVADDGGKTIGCYGGPGEWTYFIAHPKPGRKVQLESDSFPGWFVTIDEEVSLVKMRESMGMDLTITTVTAGATARVNYDGIIAIWKRVEREAGESNGDYWARVWADIIGKIQRANPTGDGDAEDLDGGDEATHDDMGRDGEQPPDQENNGGGQLQSGGGLSMDYFGASGFGDLEDPGMDEQMLKLQKMELKDALFEKQQKGVVPIPEHEIDLEDNTLIVGALQAGIVIPDGSVLVGIGHRRRNEYVQMIDDDKIDCDAESISKDNAVWLIEPHVEEGDDNVYCKIRNYAVLGRTITTDQGRKPKSYLSCDGESIEVNGKGGDWTVFKVEYFPGPVDAATGKIRKLWKFYNEEFGQYLCVNGAGEMLSRDPGSDEANEGALFRLVPDVPFLDRLTK